MGIPFVKMQGAGNDYVYVDAAACPIPDPAALSRAVSRRRFGVGADGLVLVLPSERADFRVRVFNADGSEAPICGNACRCVGKLVYDRGMTRKTSLTLETGAGLRALELFPGPDGRVEGARVEMGRASFLTRDIPAAASLPRLAGYPVRLLGREWRLTALSVGNPHAVIPCRDPAALDLGRLGPAVQALPLFPQGVNVEFIRMEGPRALSMRVWERGSGETWACGTGACAAAAAAVELGLCPAGEEIRVRCRGGELSILCREDGTLAMAGPAVTVFSGEYPWPAQ